ncbi:uncharacterized protein [Oryza sativa Japonica Group]|uniref:uncharacterized protein isoform X1 n=1 Tax=Oryza sativa subsp. japonica TaxID=39947 RepID=UPI00077539DE|nr:ATP-dependent DNA helicase PIF1 isoform X1 [Oryza sativa Japonica Group]XP_015621011.1 ATP-dependent DNA helicase PIF1 isoform X1 [Oryza sativa Japonica Group]XP_015621012.1 ATP-dependent DNA helicase PIF1 isoform X1 [Oryza sativa Japonica Group]XP_015621013.1 ATP-dependent DNA helicase PIF1 isoform X1 [Oryza sativa Japonica Group]XP_015621014.1 ATP-dependent DNA helicase PIF1 isoform X1 [Oryza sativa Japonica Group]XP_015621015.1 ATP-dependent DNA helicase PIF1 isoform X1 [Oryza sativa Jap
MANLRSRGEIVLAVASSGVAALLMPGGRIAHSWFRIPIDIHDRSMCAIRRGTILGDLIRKASLIIWDEAPMTHKLCFEALDRTLRDIQSADEPANEYKPFGGKPILLGGDFRQVLPVIEKGTRADVVDASLVRSALWKHVEVLHLTTNMRLHNPSLSQQARGELAEFAKWVLDIGEGRAPMNKRQGEVERTWIEIPKELLLTPCGDKITAIIDAVYPDFELNYDCIPYLSQRAIVCPVNTVVDEINDNMLAKVPGDAKDYLSSDTISNTLEKPVDFDLLYPIEFLNSISINNFQEHRISLKIGSAVVLLRNINQSLGLCNETRLMVIRLSDYVFESKIMTGTNIGQLVCIPWIVLSGNSPKWPFTLQRRQFPIRLCYAMTINKCQGQTLGNVGVYLRNPVFTHGQLYVAVSRATSKQGLKLLIEDDDGKPCSTTRNIVYTEILSLL